MLNSCNVVLECEDQMQEHSLSGRSSYLNPRIAMEWLYITTYSEFLPKSISDLHTTTWLENIIPFLSHSLLVT